VRDAVKDRSGFELVLYGGMYGGIL